ncbi:MAG: hypothetical protein AMXMBFR56_49380 [Polyangiaceae bacterium]
MQAMTELTTEQPASSNTIKDTNDETNDTSTQEQNDNEAAKNPFTTGAICLADLAHEPLPKVEYVVERLAIAPGRPTVIFGQSGRGKTLFTSYIASCVALNLPLFGRHDVRAGEVLHLDYELGAVEMQTRYRQMVVGLGLDLDAAPGIWFRSYPGVKLDEAAARAHLRQAMDGKQLFIIDPLSRATSATDNDPRIGDALAMTGELSNELGVAVVWVHHEGKRVGTGYGRGSSAIQDSAGCVLRVSSPERGRFCVEQVKAVPHPVAPLMFQIEEAGGIASETRRARGLRLVEFDPDATPVVAATNKTDVRQEIIRHLEEHADGLSGRDLRKAVGGNTSRFVQSMRVLVAQSIVRVLPDPRDGRKQIYMMARNAPDFVPTNGTVIQFPGRRDESEGDDV